MRKQRGRKRRQKTELVKKLRIKAAERIQKWRAWWMNLSASVRCVDCNLRIGTSGAVQHVLKVGGWYLPICENCHSALVQRYLEFRDKLGHGVIGKTADEARCVMCEAQGDPHKMSDPLRDQVLLVSFWRPKRKDGDDNFMSFETTPTGPIKVHAHLTLCPTCMPLFLPHFSAEWAEDDGRYWHLRHLSPSIRM